MQKLAAGSELSPGDPTGVRTPVTGVRGEISALLCSSADVLSDTYETHAESRGAPIGGECQKSVPEITGALATAVIDAALADYLLGVALRGVADKLATSLPAVTS
jgi:hypothetical protein